MVPLLRKELGGLTSFVWAAMLFGGGGSVLQLVTTPTNQWSLGSHTINLFQVSEGPGVFLLGLVLGALLLQEEFDRGTQGFLDTLPVTRSQIFFAKVLAGWLVLAVIPVSDLLAVLAMHALSTPANDPGMHLDVLAPVALFPAVCGVVVLGLALPMSFLGRLGWMLTAVWLMVTVTLEDALPELAWISPWSLMGLDVVGREIEVPWGPLGVQLAISAFGYACAWWLYVGAGARMGASLEVHRQRLSGMLATAVGVVMMLLALIVVAYVYETLEDEEEDDRLVAGTLNYRIAYEDADADAALALARVADGNFDRVTSLLGIDEQADPPILVDTTGMGSAAHLGGTFSGSMIRMGVGHEDAVVLAHETVHALLARTAPEFLAQHGAAFGVFNEGLADWVDRHISGEPTDACLDLAAFAYLRHQIPVDELLQPRSLRSDHGPELVYTMGCSFWEVLGADAIPGAVAALATPDLQRHDEARNAFVHWFDVMDRSFDGDLSTLGSRLRAREDRIAGWLRLDAPRVSLVHDDEDELVFVRTSGLPVGAKLRVRVRGDASDGASSYRYGFENDGEVPVSMPAGASTHIDLQLGYSVEGTVLWWPFQRVSVEETVERESVELGGVVDAVTGPELGEVESRSVPKLPPSPPPVTWGTPLSDVAPFGR